MGKEVIFNLRGPFLYILKEIVSRDVCGKQVHQCCLLLIKRKKNFSVPPPKKKFKNFVFTGRQIRDAKGRTGAVRSSMQYHELKFLNNKSNPDILQSLYLVEAEFALSDGCKSISMYYIEQIFVHEKGWLAWSQV
jgi:hypothetical protein